MNSGKIRIVYTILLFIAQIAFGLTSAVYGPSLVDLSVIFSKNNNDDNDTNNDGLGPVSLFFTFFCGGCITGSFCKSLPVCINLRLRGSI
ncbi:hypothetical protein BLA29_005495 [Euroglyphus maynei]|uniref:Uncharacterized protein n=1 Tax=Euroglyphus maynei TaxID=6958 RepID=A0A1Y3APA0_EURMA|nr:hypothetical protein BLA29_005495 [Euroglyphus maynei]